MRESTVRCQTLVGAKMVWAGAKDKNGNKIVRNGKVVRYPTIIIPDENPDGHRCDNPSVVSKRRNGVTEHKCASHVGTWYVDVDGRRHNFDNELLD